VESKVKLKLKLNPKVKLKLKVKVKVNYILQVYSCDQLHNIPISSTCTNV